ncbi:extracellular solute-binding protein [Gracilibacillus sp. YIM 98692]|uniref:ABC transporter substrate-binding protein n=1 Tax=Gracilibacillus sp. YIM 98692 TaxID=2663532 RepID=UPI0013D3DF44|nr:extracellular solute-binding protein [Gracilibacillus sp. YIM 98692]
MKKNLLFLFVFLLIGMLTLAACSSNGGEEDASTDEGSVDNDSNDSGEDNEQASSDDGENITLTVWFGRGDFIPEDNFETFHEENPNITVETDVIPLEQSVSDFIRNFNAGNAPDIFQTYHENIPALNTQNALYDMTSQYEEWEANDPDSYNKLMPQAFDVTSYDGAIHGLGVHMGPRWHVYRNDLFEEAGLDFPETWDDVIESGIALRDSGLLEDGQYAYAIVAGADNAPNWFQSQFQAMGGEYVDGVPQMDTEAGHYLIDFYQTLKKEELIHPESISWTSGEMRGAFIGENAAMATIGDNIFPVIKEDLSEYGEKWVASTQPHRPGAEDKWRPNASSWPMVVSQDIEHPEAVTKVLQYLIDTETVREVAHRYQPTTNSEVMTEQEYFEAKPWQEELAEPFGEAEMIPSSTVHPQVMSVLLELMQYTITNPDEDPASIAETYQAQLDDLG